VVFHSTDNSPFNHNLEKAHVTKKTVIVEFDTEGQADKFFGMFDDRAQKSIEVEDQTERTVNNLLKHCGVECVETKQHREHYSLKLS
jgi:outer membrane protein assembly factor BamE (lipoprotein component of BamABCDE complex)